MHCRYLGHNMTTRDGYYNCHFLFKIRTTIQAWEKHFGKMHCHSTLLYVMCLNSKLGNCSLCYRNMKGTSMAVPESEVSKSTLSCQFRSYTGLFEGVGELPLDLCISICHVHAFSPL